MTFLMLAIVSLLAGVALAVVTWIGDRARRPSGIVQSAALVAGGVAALALLLGLVFALISLKQVSDVVDAGNRLFEQSGQDESASVGWGLMLLVGAMAVGTVASLVAVGVQGRRLVVGSGGATSWSRTGWEESERPMPRHGAGQVGLLDGGRPSGTVTLRDGQRLIVGRSPDADLRISDPRASREHLAIEFDGRLYRLTDLNSTNPARVVAGARPGQMPRGGQTSLASGQVTIGNSVITLYPFDNR